MQQTPSETPLAELSDPLQHCAWPGAQRSPPERQSVGDSSCIAAHHVQSRRCHEQRRQLQAGRRINSIIPFRH